MARDIIHTAVKNALIKDGWTITHDPYPIQYDDVDGYADLGAERLIAASRESEKIVVEVKSFIGRSIRHDFQQSLGQYLMYRNFLEFYEPERAFFLAMSGEMYGRLEQVSAFQRILTKFCVHRVIVDDHEEEIVRWIRLVLPSTVQSARLVHPTGQGHRST